jgi:hypothetical protein
MLLDVLLSDMKEIAGIIFVLKNLAKTQRDLYLIVNRCNGKRAVRLF